MALGDGNRAIGSETFRLSNDVLHGWIFGRETDLIG